MREYQQAHMNLRIWGCKDASIEANTYKPEDMRMWGARIQETTHEPEDMRMQGCKQGHMNLKIQGCKDARIQASTDKHKDMRMRGCEDINQSNIQNL